MAELDDKVIVTKQKITDIADALREEMSESNEYSLPTMVQKVHELGQGQGSEYTAGVGIDITNRVVSVVDTLMIRGNASGSVASIVDGADDIPLKSCIVAIEPVQSGSGAPSPSNVRPISGWTEANLNDVGKNLCPTNSGTIKQGNFVVFTNPLPSGTYSFSLKATRTPSSSSYASLVLYDKDGVNYSDVIGIGSDKLNGNRIETQPRNLDNGLSKIVAYSIAGNWSESQNYTLSISELQIELGSTVTEYEPYNSNSQIYNIEFPSEAGTVYGGTLDVTNGVLTVTDGYIASYNGETLPSTWISSMDVYAEGTTPTTGAEVVYKLATPQTYNLTPTEVKTLLGINNIFADCGDVDVEYVRDATLIINKLLELVSGNNNRTMMKSAVVEKTDEVQEQKKDSVEEDLDA